MSLSVALFVLDPGTRRRRLELPAHAPVVMKDHRGADRRVVLVTTAPSSIAEKAVKEHGFDAVITSAAPGRPRLAAVRRWASENDASMRRSHAYASSVLDAPLLAEVGSPVAADPDPALSAVAWLKGWPSRSLHAPEGVLTIAGREVQDIARPAVRPELVPLARFEFDGLEHVPASGPAIVVANHRSYFDAVTVPLALARAGRTVRFLGKKEVFDVPVVGRAARWIGGIRVERASGSDEPLDAAAAALAAGDVVMLMPQGTIPRGPAFFDPVLKGRWGAAKLAAMTRAPVIPVGVWGTEKVWPRSSRLPRISQHRPLVTLRAGPPVRLLYDSPGPDTRRIMTAITALLPPEARERREPTDEELARTYPAGRRPSHSDERARRPGTED